MHGRFRGLTIALLAAAATVATPAPAVAQTNQDPVARFEDPLCPGVAGLTQEAAEAMVGRIRENAEALGLRLAKNGDCHANLVVAFVEDGQAYLSRLDAQARYAFGEMNLADRQALLTSPGPIRVFHRVVPHSRDGRPIPRHQNLTDIPQTSMWMAHSKIYSAIRNDINYAMVLIDRDEIDDVGVGQLADYATFRGLTQVLPKVYDDSILALFEDGEAQPRALTEFDRAYLAALYRGVPNLPRAARLAMLEAATGRDIFE